MKFRIEQNKFFYEGLESRYTQISKDEVSCFYAGLLVYGDCQTVDESIQHLIDDFRSKGINYTKLLGSYRVILFDSVNNEVTFFADNAGTLCFFYDTKTPHIVSDALLPLLMERSGNQPNYDWIAQFLQFGHWYSFDTVVTSVKRTSPNSVYRLNGTGISEFSKQLPNFSKSHDYQSLQDILKKLVRACKQQKIVSVITGGTDSRAVLANLLSLGISPELTITGRPQDIDVQIAHEIAELLKLPLLFFEDTPQEPDWIENSFLATDAMSGVLGRYRLYSKAKQLKELGFTIQFGGVAGELYKNSFINQDYPIYNRDPYQLEMQRFQRNEIHTHAPQLANIRTDRGLTCSAVEKNIRKEVLKSFSVLVNVGLTRAFKRKTVSSRIDTCFTQGLASKEYRRAIQVCKKMSLIPEEILPEEIPKGLADRFMMLGMLFDRI